VRLDGFDPREVHEAVLYKEAPHGRCGRHLDR
jgi:hypothetical protein